MSDETAYLDLLGKARENLPENAGNKERWELPAADVIKEGRMTILRNYRQVLDALRRDEVHVTKFLLSQIGTAGSVDGDRLVMTGAVTPDQVNGRLGDYVGTYVQCSECGSPDTHLERDGRIQLLQCEACGAHQPVKARKARRPQAAVKEGGKYEVKITATGKKGDGIAKYEGYTIIIPGAQMGQDLIVEVTRVNGQTAFGRPVNSL